VIPGENDDSIWVYERGVVRPVFRQGDPAPSIPGGVITSVFPFFVGSPLAINSTGGMSFRTRYGPGSPLLAATWFLPFSGATPQLIGGGGTQIPDTDAPFDPGFVAMNSAGDQVLQSGSVLAYRPRSQGTLHAVLLAGIPVTVTDGPFVGESVTPQILANNTGFFTGGESFFAPIINDHGKIAFRSGNQFVLLIDVSGLPGHSCPVDVDGDGRIDIDDLYYITQHPTDINGDGIADAEDAACLERFLRRNELEDMSAGRR
jgi:hypothetical protein